MRSSALQKTNPSYTVSNGSVLCNNKNAKPDYKKEEASITAFLNNNKLANTKDDINENYNSGVENFGNISILPPSHLQPQPKLKINSPNDKYEQEADRVAEQVMRMPEPGVQRKCTKCGKEEVQPTSDITIQRKCAGCEEEEMLQMKTNGNATGTASTNLMQQIQSTRGKGKVLENNTRSFMESRMGVDFSGVQIHTGHQAAQMNKGINAKAFTIGKDIYFNQGEFQPDSAGGKKLLAHELTHVVQQNTTKSGPTVQRQANPVSCPTTINSDTTLTTNCTNGIQVAANNITLDCNFHRLNGSGNGAPVRLTGREGVTVKNCVFENFNEGILLRRSHRNTFVDNTIRNNTRDGADLNFSNENSFIKNIFSNNTLNGIELDDSNNNRIIGNDIKDNGENISLDRSNGNTFTGNDANGTSQGSGIHLDQSSSNNNFSLNTANNTARHGIRLDDNCTANSFTNNTANNNPRDGIRITDGSNRNVFDQNTANNNRDGFHIENSNNNIFTNNTATGNSSDDIGLPTGTGNRCTGNSFTHRRCPP